MRVNLYLILLMIFSSCASGYRSHDPGKYTYKTLYKSDRMEYYMIQNVFEKGGNTKYAKKEKKKNVRMVAMKIVNTTDSAIVLTNERFEITEDEERLSIISPIEFHNKVKQQSALYLLWCLANVVYPTVEFKNGQPPPVTRTYVIPTGVPIGVGNFIVSESANKRLKKDLLKYSLLGKTINPNEEVVGYIYISKTGEGLLKIEVK